MTPKIKHYFVDEAGDLTLFDKKGRIIVGKEGSSNLFMVGSASVSNPSEASVRLNNLRSQLLSDPYFKDVPSMQSKYNKTAICFHAKDDLPEVRREVFKLLPQLGVKIYVDIKRKTDLAVFAQNYFRFHKAKLRDNELYDYMIKVLFRNNLHKADENYICFSRRGKSDRTQALANAIKNAQLEFETFRNKKSDKQINIISKYPSEEPCLQIIDYYLWALQRLFEKGEDRFFNLLKNDFRIIRDLDDKRKGNLGAIYYDRNPLELKKIKPVQS
ncbi:MAG: DUF3800 domain-containing protein [Ignavibacteria bacterium]|nr:DUF3800 domain-containing protein [Ignavibacteria bacterium]